MAPVAIIDPFARLGLTAQTKLLLPGARDLPTEDLASRARSLQLEHVSPSGPAGRGISRTLSPPAERGPGKAEDADLARLRRWFFARKPDAGFVLADFPATLLQAKVFDEWLDARGETLDAVLPGPGAPGPVLGHYRQLGLLAEDRSFPPPGPGPEAGPPSE